ncbi:hypothetical protein GCM10009120_31660 [Sphingobacterium siyangense subsp. cladoniae]|uniref:hypothetical protein n=1 Tax=Sphingobacterium siyangense TaxID=459529 RepID=UPI0031F949CC
MKKIKKISQNLAHLYLLFTREPFALALAEEIEYYVNSSGGILGIILKDNFDKDFSIVVLSRDESRQYKAISIKVDLPTLENAREILTVEMAKDHIIFHNDSKFFDVFKQINKPQQEHPHFRLLRESASHSSAKEAIKEVSYHYKDIDGNFIDQFQSINGFDARLWELYLYCFFREQLFSFNRNHEAPDYLVEKGDAKIAVEAVVISRKNTDFGPKIPKTSEEMNKLLINEIPIMVSNVIYSKAKKKYWEKEHVKGIPFALAIADFHDAGSMVWTFEAFLTALYGIRPKMQKDSNEKMYQVLENVSFFTKNNGTEIPAGMFLQKDYENISAVIYNPTATLSKFNRIGRQAGLGTFETSLIWIAAFHDHTPGALLPKMAQLIIDENFCEPWSGGANVFHNPNAVQPIDPHLFDGGVAHYHFREGKIISFIPEVHPYNGYLLNLNLKDSSK